MYISRICMCTKIHLYKYLHTRKFMYANIDVQQHLLIRIGVYTNIHAHRCICASLGTMSKTEKDIEKLKEEHLYIHIYMYIDVRAYKYLDEYICIRRTSQERCKKRKRTLGSSKSGWRTNVCPDKTR